jgi:hypothetical protein
MTNVAVFMVECCNGCIVADYQLYVPLRLCVSDDLQRFDCDRVIRSIVK